VVAEASGAGAAVEESARPAVAGDLAVLGALSDACVAELRPERGGALWAARDARPVPGASSLAADLADPDALVVAGEADGLVVGLAVVRAETLPTGDRLGRITDLYVEPGFRELGVGEAMLGLVLDWATGRGCVGVDAVALPGMRATKNFFESFGLVARAIVVHRPLGSPTAEPGGA
jgi:GNAT superfamily N-acetyltransferase